MIEAELGRFGDKRLACVGGALLRSMQSKRTFCVHRLGQGPQSDGAVRPFPGELRGDDARDAGDGGGAADQHQRAAGRHVLAIMDTTDLRSFPTHEASKRGFGRDANDTCPDYVSPAPCRDGGRWEWRCGRAAFDCVVLNRTGGEGHLTTRSGQRMIKSPADGCTALEIAGDRLTQAAMITMVGDRESDIYDLLFGAPAGQGDFAVPLCSSTRHDHGWPDARVLRRPAGAGAWRRSRNCRREGQPEGPPQAGDGGGSWLRRVIELYRSAPGARRNRRSSELGRALGRRCQRG